MSERCSLLKVHRVYSGESKEFLGVEVKEVGYVRVWNGQGDF